MAPWDSLIFEGITRSPGESHKFMSQSERLKTGCTDRESRETSIPPSPRAPRPRERERMGVLSLGIMDIRGIWRKWKEQNAPIRKQKTQKKNRDIKGIWGNSKKKTHQSEIGDQKKNRNIDPGNFGEMKGKNAPIKK